MCIELRPFVHLLLRPVLNRRFRAIGQMSQCGTAPLDLDSLPSKSAGKYPLSPPKSAKGNDRPSQWKWFRKADLQCAEDISLSAFLALLQGPDDRTDGDSFHLRISLDIYFFNLLPASKIDPFLITF